MKLWKKVLAALLVLTLLLAGFAVAVAAGGHHSKAQCALCPVKNCNTVETHAHNNRTYAGHYMEDGHNWHRLCPVKNCEKTQCHVHNNAVCLPRVACDGTGQRRMVCHK